MSKGYTISFFISQFNNATNRQLNTKGVYGTVSPRLGFNSVKATALDRWLGGYPGAAESVANDVSLGKTPRTRLLKALRFRQKNGTVL